MSDAGILQFHCVHKVVQGHMGVASTQTHKQWGQQTAERDDWISAKSAE